MENALLNLYNQNLANEATDLYDQRQRDLVNQAAMNVFSTGFNNRNTGILSQVDSGFPLYDDFTVAEEGDDLEDNAVTVDELGNLKQPSGFKDFLKTMLGFAIPGSSLFTGDRSALQGIKSLNQRIQQSDFAQADNLMDYLDMRKYGGLQGRNDAAARTMTQARGITKSLASKPSSTSGGYQQGPGGSGAQTTSAKSKTSSPTNVGNPFGYR